KCESNVFGSAFADFKNQVTDGIPQAIKLNIGRCTGRLDMKPAGIAMDHIVSQFLLAIKTGDLLIGNQACGIKKTVLKSDGQPNGYYNVARMSGDIFKYIQALMDNIGRKKMILTPIA